MLTVFNKRMRLRSNLFNPPVSCKCTWDPHSRCRQYNYYLIEGLNLGNEKSSSGSPVSQITVIYDGECQLCKNSISWVSKKLSINPLDYHTANLASFDVSPEQCSREVFVFCGSDRFSGSMAAAFLLQRRGNHIASAVITAAGPISSLTYRWIATHRNSLPVRILSRLLQS